MQPHTAHWDFSLTPTLQDAKNLVTTLFMLYTLCIGHIIHLYKWECKLKFTREAFNKIWHWCLVKHWKHKAMVAKVRICLQWSDIKTFYIQKWKTQFLQQHAVHHFIPSLTGLFGTGIILAKRHLNIYTVIIYVTWPSSAQVWLLIKELLSLKLTNLLKIYCYLQ